MRETRKQNDMQKNKGKKHETDLIVQRRRKKRKRRRKKIKEKIRKKKWNVYENEKKGSNAITHRRQCLKKGKGRTDKKRKKRITIYIYIYSDCIGYGFFCA